MFSYERFESICKSKGYTPSGLCVAIGRSKNLAAKWKSTGSMPSAEVLNQIAAFFDVSVDYLLGKAGGDVEDEIAVRQEISAGNAYDGSNPPAPTKQKKPLIFKGFFVV